MSNQNNKTVSGKKGVAGTSTDHEHISDEKCPKCGKALIINDAGASWCSNEENCDYADKGAAKSDKACLQQSVVMCGNCPFLKIIPAHKTWVDIPEDHIEGWAKYPRENICLVEGLWRLGYCGDLIGIEGIPIRSDKCIELTKNIINQFCS